MDLLRTANDIRIFILPNVVVYNIKLLPLTKKFIDVFDILHLLENKFLKFFRSVRSCNFPFYDEIPDVT